jgi:hypothetical protein
VSVAGPARKRHLSGLVDNCFKAIEVDHGHRVFRPAGLGQPTQASCVYYSTKVASARQRRRKPCMGSFLFRGCSARMHPVRSGSATAAFAIGRSIFFPRRQTD